MTLTHGTLDHLRALQTIVGEANAKKGFHEEGAQIRGGKALGVIALQNREGALGIVARWVLRLLPSFERNYYTSRLALITTEVAEAIEELRHGRAVDETYYMYDDGETEAPTSYDPMDKPRKPEGVPSELADVVIRAFDFAHEAGIDLAAMIDEKLTYNATRAHKHGKTF